MVFSLLIGMALAKGIAEGAHVAKGGMTFNQEKEFDKEIGYNGLASKDVVSIAQRNGIYPNKKGVLPYAEPPKRVLDYVKKYCDSSRDLDDFKKNWRITVKKQLDEKHEKIRKESYESKEYDRNLKYRKNKVIPNLSSSKTKIFTIDHWFSMPKSIHQERVEKIVNNTILREFLAGPPVLRKNDIKGSYTEFFKVMLDADSKNVMSEKDFNQLYRQCCAKIGFEY